MAGENVRVERRSFLSRLGAGAAMVGAAIGLGTEQTAAQSSSGFQPMRHADDDWLDQVPGKHRLVMDSTTPSSLGHAIFFTNNFYAGSRTGYMLTDADSAIVVVVRHMATAFAYDDAIWAKYGGPLSERAAGFTDPKTGKAPVINVFQTTGYGAQLNNMNTTLDAIIKRGMRLAVCQMATRANAQIIAQRTGGNVDDIYKEISEHLLANARLVPAGIVTVNRAQERGYAFTYVA
jgi:hypothetical protein